MCKCWLNECLFYFFIVESLSTTVVSNHDSYSFLLSLDRLHSAQAAKRDNKLLTLAITRQCDVNTVVTLATIAERTVCVQQYWTAARRTNGPGQQCGENVGH